MAKKSSEPRNFRSLMVILGIVVACILIYGSVYYYSLTKIEFVDARVNEIKDLSIDSFTLLGDIKVHNGGMFDFDIKNINYSLILESTRTTLTEGIIEGRELASKETETFSFSNRINVLASGEAIMDFINTGDTHARIEGTITLSNDMKVKFKDTVDLGPYMDDFTRQHIDPLLGGDTKELAKALVNSLGALFG